MELLMLILVVVCYLSHGSAAELAQDGKSVAKRQLVPLNKPPIKSFVTDHGDTLDCVDIYKQHAFDNPLLKNHSIQMKPTFKIAKHKISSTQTPLFNTSIICPKGTVLVQRIQEQEIDVKKFIPLLANTSSTSNFSNSSYPNDEPPQFHHEVAALVAETHNTGASGDINLWNPEVQPDQFSLTSIFVANDDSPGITNTIMVGWGVLPFLYNDTSTRLYAYWTKDSGKSTGCYNAICPGFVQTSDKATLGQILGPISQRRGEQYFVGLAIQQDVKTKNWWLSYNGEFIGYWPKELFSSLNNGSIRTGWGGEIQSPINEPTPGMGASRLAEENFSEACLIKFLTLYAPQGFPHENDLKYYLSNPKCYDVSYSEYPGGIWGNNIFFGGPPGCKY